MRLLYLILLVLVSYNVAAGQEYKEGLIYDIMGNVKEFKLKTENKYLKKHIKFEDNGKSKRSLTFFDGNGFPLGYSLNFGKNGLGQSITYDSLQRIDSIIDTATYKESVVRTTKRIYSQKGNDMTEIAKVIFNIISKDGEKSIVCEYSDYVYDERGNWISRNVTEFENTLKSRQYTEIRKIKYY